MSKSLSVLAADRKQSKQDKYEQHRVGFDEPGYEDLRRTAGVEGANKWNTRKSQSQELAGKLRTVVTSERATKIADKSGRCAVSLTFGHDGERFKVIKSMRCHQKWCPVCAAARAEEMKRRFLEALPHIEERHPTGKWLMLTLTVKNPKIADLRATVQSMNKAWQRLIQRKDWPALGFVRATEVTLHNPERWAKGGKDRGPAPGECHPHFHALLFVPSNYFTKGYIKQEEWAARWQKCARLDYAPVVHVQSAKAKETKAGEALTPGQAAALEVLKYSVKAADLVGGQPHEIAQVIEQIDRLKFVVTGGVVREVMGELDEDEGEQAELDLTPAFSADWRAKNWLYAKRLKD